MSGLTGLLFVSVPLEHPVGDEPTKSDNDFIDDREVLSIYSTDSEAARDDNPAASVCEQGDGLGDVEDSVDSEADPAPSVKRGEPVRVALYIPCRPIRYPRPHKHLHPALYLQDVSEVTSPSTKKPTPRSMCVLFLALLAICN